MREPGGHPVSPHAPPGPLVQQGRGIGARVDVIPNDDEVSSIDVHAESDFWLAKKMRTEWKVEDE